ncbi:MAG TPA: DNA alkylation repair protein [Anaerolineales bacterium]|nr:DNA alkylation repair protein [Anaerolineales bacterium]
MKTREARELGAWLAGLVQRGELPEAYSLLFPVLSERTKFDMLRLIGHPIGMEPLSQVNTFLELIGADKSEGGWVVIGSALEMQFDRDHRGAFDRCREYIIAGDVWYAADILGEQVPGNALVADFEPSLRLLESWRVDESRWVRRAVGVSAHHWAKRARGADEKRDQAAELLDFLEPSFAEWQIDAAKGTGWGLKTLGRYYPDLTAAWLREQVVVRKRRHRAIILRKALTYLSPEQRDYTTGVST